MAWAAGILPSLTGVAILILVATGVLSVCRVPHRWAPALAILRGTVQLAIISFVLAGSGSSCSLRSWQPAPSPLSSL